MSGPFETAQALEGLGLTLAAEYDDASHEGRYDEEKRGQILRQALDAMHMAETIYRMIERDAERERAE